jgi:hypothetical protein
VGDAVLVRILELPDMLRKYDVEPVLAAGWETRGIEFPSRPDGALRHWTYGGLALGWPSMNTLIYGRGKPGDSNYLPGPLCQVSQERGPSTRDDRCLVIASGKANHAGEGEWNGISGNYRLLGNEIEWRYDSEPFPARRVDVSERIMAALLDCCLGTDNNDVAEHREYAPTRKIDTNLSGDDLRRRVAELRSGLGPAPSPTTPSIDEEDDIMNFPAEIVEGDATVGTWYVTDRVTKQHIKNRYHAAILVQGGHKAENPGTAGDLTGAQIKPFRWPQKALDSIRTVGS